MHVLDAMLMPSGSVCILMTPGAFPCFKTTQGAGRKVTAHPAKLRAGAPPAEALVEVQHGDVGEVGHAGDDLQEPEALDGALVVDDVQHKAQAARRRRENFIARLPTQKHCTGQLSYANPAQAEAADSNLRAQCLWWNLR